MIYYIVLGFVFLLFCVITSILLKKYLDIVNHGVKTSGLIKDVIIGDDEGRIVHEVLVEFTFNNQTYNNRVDDTTLKLVAGNKIDLTFSKRNPKNCTIKPIEEFRKDTHNLITITLLVFTCIFIFCCFLFKWINTHS